MCLKQQVRLRLIKILIASRNSKVCSSKLTKSAKTVTSTSQKDRRKTFYLLDENKKKAIGRLSTVMEEESTLEESRQSTNETKQKLLISEARTFWVRNRL